ncbi:MULTISPECIES: hypothetical protein [unclassified Streptomyces]
MASNTKTMTAALITLLAQDGRIKLGDPCPITWPGFRTVRTSPSPTC